MLFRSKAADIECGRRAGTRTILVKTGYGREQDCAPDLTCADAVEAMARILAAPPSEPVSRPNSDRDSGGELG